MKVTYRRLLPHPPERVLSQYFDLEHLPFVHPRTFGAPRVLSCQDLTVVWQFDLHAVGLRFPTTIAQEFYPPHRIHTRVTTGFFSGTVVSTHLLSHLSGTLVDETYEIPIAAIPPLSSLIRFWLIHWLNRVWDEDLRVGMPYGGWPGVPGTSEFGA